MKGLSRAVVMSLFVSLIAHAAEPGPVKAGG